MPATAQDLVYAIVDATNVPEVSFPQLLQQIHAQQFTGEVVLHFRRGVPQKVEFPQPLTLELAPRT